MTLAPAGPGSAAGGRTETVRLVVDPEAVDEDHLEVAARALRRGGTVAFPTETVYGLGADALRPEAVARIFEAKGRPGDNPLIVHIGDPSMVDDVAVDVSEHARALMDRFWPGPLTLVLHRAPGVPDETTAGLDTVGVRMPAHPVARALLRAAGVPVAAPSANRSGSPSPTRAEHVQADLDGRINVIVDGGACSIGVESTVVDVTAEPAVLLRPGGVTLEDLTDVLGTVVVHEGAAGVGEAAGSVVVPRSPGLKYRHYAPRAELRLVDPKGGDVDEALGALVSELAASGRNAGFLVSNEAKITGPDVVRTGARGDAGALAQALFAGLRTLDDRAYEVIVVEGVHDAGLGRAVMDRLRRAVASGE